tara:strand:- start:8166 stop:8597 length:432 start_codon:yes stop_codon:yes gene_type:complete
MSAYSVLIVDDSDNDRYILKRELKQIGIDSKIFESGDGQSALELLTNYEENKSAYDDEFPPTVIFLDINMPFVDGFAFLEKFSNLKKNHDMYNSIIIMMFTSSEMEAEREKALSYDCVADYLVKGEYSTDELKGKIETVVTKT